jgi:hypothetical protein
VGFLGLTNFLCVARLTGGTSRNVAGSMSDDVAGIFH